MSQSIEVATQDRTDADGQRTDPTFDKGGECSIDVTVAANIQGNHFLPDRGRCRKHIALLRLDSPLIRIAGKISDRRRLRDPWPNKSSRFLSRLLVV